ncbi:hypothetical protein [Baaleninema sp.]
MDRSQSVNLRRRWLSNRARSRGVEDSLTGDLSGLDGFRSPALDWN